MASDFMLHFEFNSSGEIVLMNTIIQPSIILFNKQITATDLKAKTKGPPHMITLAPGGQQVVILHQCTVICITRPRIPCSKLVMT